MSPRTKKVLSDLLHNPWRSILVVLSMATGVFAVGMVAGTYKTLLDSMEHSYQAANPPHATINFIEPVDADLHESVKHFRGVKDAQSRRTVSLRVQKTPEDWRPLRLIAIDDFRDVTMGRFTIDAARVPPPQDHLYVEKSAMEWFGAHVGDRILVETARQKKRILTISGVVQDMTQTSASFSGRMAGYISFDTVEALGEDPRPDQLLLQVDLPNPTRKQVHQIAQRVRNRLLASGFLVGWVWVPPPGQHPAQDPINTLLIILLALGVLILFLSGFLLVNTMGALLTHQTRQIGIMKAIGATTAQLTAMYMALVAAYCTLSVALAIPLGLAAARAATTYMAGLLNMQLDPFEVPPPVLLGQVALGYVVPILAALVPVARASGITVREAVAFYGLSGGAFGHGLIDRLVARLQMLSRPALLSLRNTFRRKGRLALTLATLSMGGATFMGVFNVRSSLTDTLEAALQYWNYDVEAEFLRPYRADQLLQEVRRVPGVKRAEAWGFSAAQLVEDWDGRGESRVFFIAPPALTDMLRPTLVAGRWLRPDDRAAVVINTEVLKNNPDVKVGDVIKVRLGLRKTEWTVVGMVRGVLAGPFLYGNRPYFSFISGEGGRASSVQIVTDSHDGAFTKAVAQRLEDHFKTVGLQVASVSASEQWRKRARKQFEVIVSFLLVMAVLMAFVGGLALTGTMGINVLERAKEVGVMRAVGATSRAVLGIFLLEGLTIGLISWVLGLVLSLPVAWALSAQVGKMFMRTPLPMAFSVQGAALWLLIIAALSAGASMVPALRAARLRIREVLASE